MRADDVALELVELAARDAYVRQQADAGVDGVDGVVALGQAVDERAGIFHLAAGGWGDGDFGKDRPGGLSHSGLSYNSFNGEAGAV